MDEEEEIVDTEEETDPEEEDADEGDEEEDDDQQAPADETPAEDEPEVETPYTPYSPPSGELPEAARLRELLADPEVSSALQATIAAEVARATASAMSGQGQLTAIASERPALWKAYGRAASDILAQQPAEQRAKPENAEGVLLMAALGPHIGKPSYGTALKKYTALYNNEEAPKVARPKTPIPAAQRPPSPSSRGTVSERPLNSTERKVEFLVKEGISKTVARAMVASGEV